VIIALLHNGGKSRDLPMEGTNGVSALATISPHRGLLGPNTPGTRVDSKKHS